MSVGIRSKMALYSPNISDFVFFRFVGIHPATNTSFSHYRCLLRRKWRRWRSVTHTSTSLSTDLSAKGRLRAGAALAEEVTAFTWSLGVDGKMQVWEGFPTKDSSLDRGRRETSPRKRLNSTTKCKKIFLKTLKTKSPPVLKRDSVFILSQFPKLPLWFFLFLVFLIHHSRRGSRTHHFPKCSTNRCWDTRCIVFWRLFPLGGTPFPSVRAPPFVISPK